MIAAQHPLDDLAWSLQQKHDMSCHDHDYDDDDNNLATMEIRMTANNIVRTARTVRTTACVSQESWTAGNQCLSASCLDEKKTNDDDDDYNNGEKMMTVMIMTVTMMVV